MRTGGVGRHLVELAENKNGPVTGRVGLLGSFPFNAWISRADVAKWMVRHLAPGPTAVCTPMICEVKS